VVVGEPDRICVADGETESSELDDTVFDTVSDNVTLDDVVTKRVEDAVVVGEKRDFDRLTRFDLVVFLSETETVSLADALILPVTKVTEFCDADDVLELDLWCDFVLLWVSLPVVVRLSDTLHDGVCRVADTSLDLLREVDGRGLNVLVNVNVSDCVAEREDCGEGDVVTDGESVAVDD